MDAQDEDQLLAALQPQLRALIREELTRSIRFTEAGGVPNTSPIAELLRDLPVLRWNSKVLGSYVAAALYEQRIASQASQALEPRKVGLRSALCRQQDIESDWLLYWARELRLMPIYHRKIWEDCFVLQALWDADLLRPGTTALGFAVGVERLPSLFASRGITVCATDLDPGDARSQGWVNTNQNAGSLQQLHFADLVDAEAFASHVRFQPADMTAIDEELKRGFDFCWSVCALEHLGSLEAGLRFILDSTTCVRPGGLCVHTTEYNLNQHGQTADNWGTVLFQRRHIEDLAERLQAAGHTLIDLDLTPGNGVLDGYVDVPPFQHHPRTDAAYPRAPHINVSVDGKPATSVGLVIRVGGA